MFLQLLIFGNIGWAGTSTGWSFTAAFFWLLLAHGAGLAAWLLPLNINRVVLAAAWIAALLSQVLLLMGLADAWITAVYLLAGQVALAGSLVAAVGYLKRQAAGDGLRNVSLAGGIGMILLVVLLFVYYAGYDIALPFSNQALPLLALLLALLVSFSALHSWWKTALQVDQPLLRQLTAVVLITLLIPPLLRITQQTPTPTASGQQIRVMTYNLHYGTNPLGQLDLEALAQVIEAEDLDVVGLQEVSRGWVINGSVDMLVWLAQRLEMTLIFGPASDAQWGNAVLSRLPLIEQGSYPLPTEDLLLQRQFIHARFSSTDGADFNLIDTHYHNPEDGGGVRVQQSEVILEFAAGMPRTIIMGDMNAEHGMPEIDMLADGGYGDVLDLTGVQPGHTNPVPGPTRRIDYIWITPDWQANSAVVPYSEASDHLPIAVSLE